MVVSIEKAAIALLVVKVKRRADALVVTTLAVAMSILQQTITLRAMLAD
jgi:hypothetical protein